jgi:DNA polymerase-3 subunit beta
LVPSRAVREFNYLLADATTARLALAADGRTMSLIADQTTLITRLIDGRFPVLDEVIPQNWRTRVTVDTAAFRQAIGVTGLFGTGEVQPVRLDALPGRLRIQAHGNEVGAVECELAAVVDGEPHAVLLDTRLLCDLLEAVRAPRVQLHWAGPQTPVVVRETEHLNAADLWVVMPLNDPTVASHQTQAVAA